MQITRELKLTYEMLRAEGRPLPARNARTLYLDGLTYLHHDGERRVIIDKPALTSVERVYAHDAVRQALSSQGIQAAPFEDAFALISRRLSQSEVVWGVSGFAKGGFSYNTEATALRTMYEYLIDTSRKPSLSVDGGVSEGNLGLNAAIATLLDIQTLGCIPLQGLASVSHRTFMVTWGNTYQDREVLVGTIPDVLVCIGGADGTRRECQAALENGSVVLMLALKDYGPTALPATYQNFPKLVEAARKGRLIICESMDNLRPSIDLAWARALNNQRSARLDKLKQLLLGA